jgi:hypothetical protein
MMIEWQEREHEEIGNQVVDDPKALEALRRCGLTIFFEISNMRVENRLLQVLINF